MQNGLLLLNTSSLLDGEEAYSSVTKHADVILKDAIMVLQQSERYHCEATYTLTNVTTLLSLLDTSNRGLIGITELETAVDTSNTVAVLRKAMETLVALQVCLRIQRC